MSKVDAHYLICRRVILRRLRKLARRRERDERRLMREVRQAARRYRGQLRSLRMTPADRQLAAASLRIVSQVR